MTPVALELRTPLPSVAAATYGQQVVSPTVAAAPESVWGCNSLLRRRPAFVRLRRGKHVRRSGRTLLVGEPATTVTRRRHACHCRSSIHLSHARNSRGFLASSRIIV